MYTGPNIPTNGLVLSLDAANTKSYVSGSTVWNDLSGNRNSGSLVNGPGFNSANGGSIQFDGVDDTVSCVPFASVSQGISISSFINVSDLSSERAILGKNDNLLSLTTNNIRWWPDVRTTNVTVTTPISTNRWYHIGVTQTGSICNIYLNGQNIFNSSATSQLTTDFSIYTLIGAYRGPQRLFMGNIASVYVYYRILSDSEMLQNYNATKSRFGL